MIEAVLFDLDGTLADTALDLGWALNALLAEHDRPPQPFDAIRPIASHGARGLIHLGFGIDKDHLEFEALRVRFLDLYDTHFAVDTVLFDGVNSMLEGLAEQGLPWGIVTNKPMRFTDKLVPELGFSVAPQVVVSGDTVGIAKPDPAPMHFAAAGLQRPSAACLYVGDAERDIVAGRVSGMKTVLARYGYIAAHDTPDQWDADYSIDSVNELLTILLKIRVEC